LIITNDIIDFNDPFFRNGYFEEKFKVIKELGSGSFEKVVEAINEQNETFAIKK
jgi:hypothetical protein